MVKSLGRGRMRVDSAVRLSISQACRRQRDLLGSKDGVFGLCVLEAMAFLVGLRSQMDWV